MAIRHGTSPNLPPIPLIGKETVTDFRRGLWPKWLIPTGKYSFGIRLLAWPFRHIPIIAGLLPGSRETRIVRFSSAESVSPDARLAVTHCDGGKDFNFSFGASPVWQFHLWRAGIYGALLRIGLPVLAAVLFIAALAWLAWWVLALWLAGAGLAVWFCRGVAIVNGRAG